MRSFASIVRSLVLAPVALILAPVFAAEVSEVGALISLDYLTAVSGDDVSIRFRDEDIVPNVMGFDATSAYLALDSFAKKMKPGVEYLMDVTSAGKTYGLSVVPPQGYIAEIDGSLQNAFYTSPAGGTTQVFKIVLRSTAAMDPSNSLQVGASTGLKVGDLHWRGGLGFRSNGTGAGFIQIESKEIGQEVYTRAGIGVHVPPHNAGEMDLIYDDVDADGTYESIRQIRTVQCLVDFVDTATVEGKVVSYEIRYYRGGSRNVSGRFDPVGSPLVVYAVSKEGASGMKLVQTDAWGTITSTATCVADSLVDSVKDWTLTTSGTGYTKSTTLDGQWISSQNKHKEAVETKYTSMPGGLPAGAAAVFRKDRTYVQYYLGVPKISTETFNPGTASERTENYYYYEDPAYNEYGLLGTKADAFGGWTRYIYEGISGAGSLGIFENTPVMYDLGHWASNNVATMFFPALATRSQKVAIEYSPEVDGTSFIGDMALKYTQGKVRRKVIQQGYGWNELEPLPVRIEETIKTGGVAKSVGSSMGALLAFPLDHNSTTGASGRFLELSALYDVPDRSTWPSINSAATRWNARHVPSAHAQENDHRLSMKPYMEIDPDQGKISHGYTQTASYQGIENAWVELDLSGTASSVISDSPANRIVSLKNPVNGAIFNGDHAIPLYYDMIGRLADLSDTVGDLSREYPGAMRNAVFADALTRYVSPGNVSHNGVTFGAMDAVQLVDGKSRKTLRAYTARGELARIENWVYVGSNWKLINVHTFSHDLFGRVTGAYVQDGASSSRRTIYEAGYVGLKLAWDRDATGTKTAYVYDGLGRLAAKTVMAAHQFSGVPTSLTSTYCYDALDRLIEVATGELKTTRAFDSQGMLVSSTDENGLTTTYSYGLASGAGMQVTITHPGSATEILKYSCNGRFLSRTGTGVIPSYHTYGYDDAGNTGNIWSRVDVGLDSGSSTKHPWVSRWKDWNGRATREESSTATAQNFLRTYQYHAGTTRLQQAVETDLAADGTTASQSLARLYEYGSMGEITALGIDVDGGGLANASNDRLARMESAVIEESGSLFVKETTYAFPKEGDATTLSSVRLTRLNGFTGNLYAEERETDPNGNTTVAIVEGEGADGVTRTRLSLPDGTTTSSHAVMGLTVEETGPQGQKAWRTFDASGRVVLEGSRDGSVAASSRKIEYVSGTALPSKVTTGLRPDGSGGGFPTSFGYDSAGRVVLVTAADGTQTASSYNLRGQLIKSWGTGARPVWYEYDATFGRVSRQYTWPVAAGSSPDFASASSPPTGASVVSITRDGATGLVTSRSDGFGSSDARVTDYTYDLLGRILTEQTPSSTAGTHSVATSRVTITRRYFPKTGELSSIAYNDGTTPGSTFTWHRSGAVKSVTEGSGDTRTFNYDYSGNGTTASRLISEDLPSYYTSIPSLGGYAAGDAATNRLVQRYTGSGMLGLPAGYDLGNNGGAGPASVTALSSLSFGWTNGLISGGAVETKISGITRTSPLSYTYAAGTDLQVGRQISSVAESRSYTPDRMLLSSIETKEGSNLRARYEYQYDSMGRRTSLLQRGSLFSIYGGVLFTQYGYDSRGGLTGATVRIGESASAPLLPGRSFGYENDLAGNRRMQTRPDAPAGATSFPESVNPLNQVVSRSIPQWAELSGTAPRDANVSVLPTSGTAARTDRAGEYFHAYHTPGGSAGAVRKQSVDLVRSEVGTGAVDSFNPGQTKDRIERKTIGLNFKASTDVLKYDGRGNIAGDGLWNYTWDAANRLIAIESSAAAISADISRVKLTFKYDWMGRRYSKASHPWNGSSFATNPNITTYFWWDGWDLVREATYGITWSGSTPSGKVFLSEIQYHWGLDISGTPGGAGGVGGLVAITRRVGTTPALRYLPAYDGNGNVIALLDEGGGEQAAFEYDPYGNVIRASGPAASFNPFRFATKYQDPETKLVYHNARYYSAELGRFLSNDPIGESGGLNLYGYVGNDPVNGVDYLGYQNYNPDDFHKPYEGWPRLWKAIVLAPDIVRYQDPDSTASVTVGPIEDAPMPIPTAEPASYHWSQTVMKLGDLFGWDRMFGWDSYGSDVSDWEFYASSSQEPASVSSFSFVAMPSTPIVPRERAYGGEKGQFSGTHGDLVAREHLQSSPALAPKESLEDYVRRRVGPEPQGFWESLMGIGSGDMQARENAIREWNEINDREDKFDSYQKGLAVGRDLGSLAAARYVAGRAHASQYRQANYNPINASSNSRPNFSGSGPASGVLEISPVIRSTKAFQNYKPKNATEFVFDPATNRFVVGRTSGPGSPHQNLARSINARNSVVGGMFKRGGNGEILTNEFSGHYWQNWTPEIRTQFQNFLGSATGQRIIHTSGM